MEYLLERASSEYEQGDLKAEPYGPAAQELAARIGMEVDSFARILVRGGATFEASVADRLLCALHMPELWYTSPELNAHYAPPKRQRKPPLPWTCDHGHEHKTDARLFREERRPKLWRCKVCREARYEHRNKTRRDARKLAAAA